MKNKGISLISMIITVLVMAILAAVMIPSGIGKINNAKLTTFNENIMTLKQESNAYQLQNDDYPIKTDGSGNPVVYSISGNTSLVAEATKKGDQSDTFYILDLDKENIDNKDIGVGKTIDDFYIVAKTSGNVYYAKGITIGNVTYYTKQNKGDGVVAVVPTSALTYTPTPTAGPTSAPAYNNPKIPTGFSHVGTETWDTGYIIQDSNGNQFVWVPVSNLTANGTLDGTNFNSKFGRRNFRSANGDVFDGTHLYETNDTNLQNMTTSVNAYGGFYIAKYEMSNNGGKAQSRLNMAPWASIDWNTSKAKAESMDTDWGWNTSAVESYLCYGSNWDTILEWLKESNDKALTQIKDDSTTWGNYINNSFSAGDVVCNTGQYSQTNAKGIYDLAGNVWEWTMENYTSSYRIYRGGSYDDNGDQWPAAGRDCNSVTLTSPMIGFRVTLYVH